MMHKTVLWLLVTALLAGCSGATQHPAPATSRPAPSPVVYTFVTVAPTTPATAKPAPAGTPNSGGMTSADPAYRAAGAATTAETSPVVRASDTPAATVSAAETPTATPSRRAPTATATATMARWSSSPHPLQIEVMRQQSYPGSAITVEQTLDSGANYSRYIVSYRSDGYKIFALMTIPTGAKPATGWPAIVFNHGYVDPTVYRATQRYVAYVDTIARSGYIVFMSDYRGWGSSEGGMVVGGGYGAPDLTVDVLNALASLKAHPDVDPNRIGMWGHSLGGQLTVRGMVVAKDIKAGVIWGGVVAPYPDVIAVWGRLGRGPSAPGGQPDNYALAWIRSFGSWVQDFRGQYGTAEQHPAFWATISPNTYLADLSGPIQLHHSTTDEMVPLAWSETLDQELKAANKQPHEFYTYPGDNHNISADFGVAMQRTVAFFDRHVKSQPGKPMQ